MLQNPAVHVGRPHAGDARASRPSKHIFPHTTMRVSLPTAGIGPSNQQIGLYTVLKNGPNQRVKHGG